MNSLDEELRETLQRERRVVANRMHATQTAVQPSTGQTTTRQSASWMQPWLRVAMPSLLVAVLGIAALMSMSNSPVATELATTTDTTPAAASAETDANSTPTVHSDGAYGPTTNIQVTANFFPSGLPQPSIDQVMASYTVTASYTTESAENEETSDGVLSVHQAHPVQPDGTINVPTSSGLQFIAPMPGVADCRWMSTQFGSFTATEKVLPMSFVLTPICGQDASWPEEVSERKVDVRVIAPDGFDSAVIELRHLRATQSFEVLSAEGTVAIEWPVDGTTTVRDLEHTSILTMTFHNLASECTLEGTGLIPPVSSASDEQPIDVTLICQPISATSQDAVAMQALDDIADEIAMQERDDIRDRTMTAMSVVPLYTPPSFPTPALDELIATSMLSSNSEEIYVVRADGSVELPTTRPNDTFTFSGPMPGVPDCRWTGNPSRGRIEVMMGPLCGTSTIDATAPLREVEVRVVASDDVDLNDVDATSFSLRQTSGFEFYSDAPVLTWVNGTTASVHLHDSTSVLVIEARLNPGVLEEDPTSCPVQGSGFIPAASATGTIDGPIDVTFSCIDLPTPNPDFVPPTPNFDELIVPG